MTAGKSASAPAAVARRVALQDLGHQVDIVTWDGNGRELTRVTVSAFEQLCLSIDLAQCYRRSLRHD